MNEVVKKKPKRVWRRGVALALAGSLLAGGAFVANESITAAPAAAASKGRGISGIPGYGWIGGFWKSGGMLVYCVERGTPDPFANLPSGNTQTSLPAYSWGEFSAPALTSPTKMRQLNYVLDKYGQTSSDRVAAGVAVAVWAIRGDSQMGKLWNTLSQSPQGISVANTADGILKDAAANAKAPVAPQKVTGKLKLTVADNKKSGTVSFPAGTTELTLTNAKFAGNNSNVAKITDGKAGTRKIAINNPTPNKEYEVKVNGKWKTTGKRGWKPQVSSWVSTNPKQQRVVGAWGQSAAESLTGTFAANAYVIPPTLERVSVSTQAQPSADVGGTMTDTAIVKGDVLPNSELDFTAYLTPTAGAKKYDSSWNEILGEEYEAQVEDPETGELVFESWWANEDGEALLDEFGAPIPATEGSSGTAADGTVYPVGKADSEGNIEFSIAKTPLMEWRRDPLEWTEAEVSAMSAAELCVAQPVAVLPKQSISKFGSYTSAPVSVKSAGTINWVEKFYVAGKVTHTGKCGISNEQTKVGAPGIMTQAQETAVVGDVITDTAIVSGRLSPNADYSVRFDAFTVKYAEDGVTPVCTADNRVFRSEEVAVTGVGNVVSPGFVVKYEHGEGIWWAERLQETIGGKTTTLHVGECGLANETTTIGRPTVSSQALEGGVPADHIQDTAIVGGELLANENAQYEVTFEGFKPAHEAAPAAEKDPKAAAKLLAEVKESDDATTPAEGEILDQFPVCTDKNKLFETGATVVTGPGEFPSEPVFAKPEWAGDIWWVETLWLIEDGKRTAIATGNCGVQNETTAVVAPEVETKAVEKAFMGEDLYDTATITGDLSAREGVRHELTFEAFQKGDLKEAVCTADNRVIKTGATPVTGPGDYESERTMATPELAGKLWWVETLWAVDGEERTKLHVGECGLENETTYVEQPKVSTTAVKHAEAGDKIHDVAHVTAPISDVEGVSHELVFEAYRQPAGVKDAVCTTENRVFTSDTVKVTKPGNYQSSEYTTVKADIGKINWVETLTVTRDGVTTQLHRGECGAKNETTFVRPPGEPLAKTGADGIPAWVFAGGAVLLIGGAVALLVVGRRRTNARVAAVAEDEQMLE